MAFFYRVKVILFFVIVIISCKEEPPVLNFVLAGHAYGHPLEDTYGIAPNLKKYLQEEKKDFVFFLGDFVRASDSTSFQNLLIDIEPLELDKYFVPGNHDVINQEEYKKYIGDNYYTITKKGLKFIVLDGNVDNWNIKGEQLKLLKNELMNFKGKIFILVHQIIWIGDDKYSDILPNSYDGMSDSLSFWTELFPILKEYENEIYVCAGDLGAFKSIKNPTYHKVGNVTLIASGMGARYRDNCIDVKLMQNGDIEFEIISLQEDLDFDDLEDYNLEN